MEPGKAGGFGFRAKISSQEEGSLCQQVFPQNLDSYIRFRARPAPVVQDTYPGLG